MGLSPVDSWTLDLPVLAGLRAGGRHWKRYQLSPTPRKRPFNHSSHLRWHSSPSTARNGARAPAPLVECPPVDRVENPNCDRDLAIASPPVRARLTGRLRWLLSRALAG